MAIVGGGPVGLGLAIELGQRGVGTVVIEKTESLHRIPKGQNLTQRTMEHLRTWGVEEAVRAARLMPPGYPAVGVNAYGNLMSRYAHPWFRRSRVGRYYFAANERLPQYLTEQALRDRVAQLPSVTALYGTTAQAVDQDGSGVVVSTDAGPIRAAYVVGCDGSRSMTREQAGIGEQRSDHDKKMILLVFRSKELHELLDGRFGEAAFFNVLDPDLDGYWRFLGRVDVGEGWFFHAPVPAGATVESFDYASLLAATVGVDVSVELDYIGFWDLRISIADSYQNGRVFIAGDAAHSHPPYGGYGINTGFEDARNLGWKLAAVLEGWGGGRLLDSYTAERRPVFESTARDFIEDFIERDRAFIRDHATADDAAFAAAWEHRRAGARGVDDYEPHYEGSPLVFGAPHAQSSAVGEHTLEARPGHHLPPLELASGADLFSSLGEGFTLLGGSDEESKRFSAAAAAIDLPLAVVTDEVGAGEDGTSWPRILVRPDHYVSWVGDGSSHDPIDVLQQCVGR